MYLLLGENKKYRHLNDIALGNLSNNKIYKIYQDGYILFKIEK